MRPASRAVAIATAAAVGLCSAMGSIPARAQTGVFGRHPDDSRCRDRAALARLYAPILRVAGLSQQNIQVVIINEKRFNAFVMDAHRIFVNLGRD